MMMFWGGKVVVIFECFNTFLGFLVLSSVNMILLLQLKKCMCCFKFIFHIVLSPKKPMCKGVKLV